ncbi:type II toxin-antitoxin system VapC family toxin [Umezawaea endophytica]|uniref:Ribonuclease VapC n=1 Tax=Umezawaea endophytica TaxID=1654476 RepID=A0A9X2VHC7_9PSEU|nr:type II toxin-antitoxin system VapC family toxin [Umezawaea endophytica]MCS7476665.1 type II toxin-antitoxin system VapC family toxin [Umezawaea endophytica]
MIGYFDTSAFVPLLITESSSEFCRRFWNDSDSVVTTRLLYVEAAAALAQGVRMGRLTDEGHGEALRLMDRMWNEFEIVEVDEVVTGRAAELAHLFALRGYDAVHVASADQLEDGDLVVASGDTKLLKACSQLGLSTADTNA